MNFWTILTDTLCKPIFFLFISAYPGLKWNRTLIYTPFYGNTQSYAGVDTEAYECSGVSLSLWILWAVFCCFIVTFFFRYVFFLNKRTCYKYPHIFVSNRLIISSPSICAWLGSKLHYAFVSQIIHMWNKNWVEISPINSIVPRYKSNVYQFVSYPKSNFLAPI